MIEYIKENELSRSYNDAVDFMTPLFKPFKEFERIARNRPHPGIAEGLPKVTDGTLAALIQEQPKRIIQQIPTGKVKATDDWLGLVAGYIFENEILANSDYVAELIQKCWALTSKSLTYGAQPAFVQFVNRGEYFGTDFTLPYIKDVLLEPGKLSDKDSNVIYLRAWFQPSDIDAICYREEMLAKRARERGEKYESTWDLKALKKAKEKVQEKDEASRTPNEEDKGLKSSGIEIIHAFQRGIGATFYSFSTATKEVVRRKTNPDPRGIIPIHYMYANIDLSNPLGRGSVELSGGMQNLLDSEVQSYQYMRALLMNPPLEVRGSNISASQLKYKPKAVWKLGNNENASVKPVQLSTSSLESFPQNYGLIKSQILNLNSSSDTSVSSDVGNPGFSKTPAGVEAMSMRLGVSDNYMRKQFESVFQEIAETEVNLYFAERSGTQELQLDKNTAAKLRKLNPEAVDSRNMIQVNYDSDTEKLKFKVDPSTSSMKDDAAERDRLVELLDLSGKYPAIAELMGKEGTKELVNRIVVKSGVEDPEKIMPTQDDQETDEQGNPIEKQEQQPQGLAPEQVAAMIEEAIAAKEAEKPQTDPRIETIKALGMKYADLPESTRQWVLSQLEMESAGDKTGAQEAADIKKFDVAQRAAGPTDVELDRNAEALLSKQPEMAGVQQ